ncbi:MAG TPA: hypothetical protein VKW78_00170 [Terriglobales bacterium]|nr:hypothetical protein [Terriglobales bacterium]
MRKCFLLLLVSALIMLLLSSPMPARAQKSAPVDPDDLEVHVDGWNRPIPRMDQVPKSSAPAPKHDISGTWEPAEGWRNGVQAQGAYNYPMDGKHPLPFTPEGEKAWKEHKYGDGYGSYPLNEVNDPFKMCDPIGFPRVSLHDLRAIQIVPTPKKTLVIYENDQVWRSIWTDGRPFPSITEPRWYGYSVGKWLDDYTFVVDTVGMDERTWIDNAGRPHTKDLKVQEEFHRVNHDLMQITLTITDPKYYTKPWNALDKYPMRLQSDTFDIREMVCSESEAEIYNKEIAEEAAAEQNQKKNTKENSK